MTKIFSLARKIGSGSFSSVYSATWESEGNTANIAVKSNFMHKTAYVPAIFLNSELKFALSYF